MGVRDIYIEKYAWRVRVYFATDHYDVDDVSRALREIGCPREIYRQARKQMVRGEVNTGFTYSNRSSHVSVMLIGKTDSGAEFLDSFTHELRHLVDDIAVECHLGMAGEAVAYLSGDIALSLSDIVCGMACDHCRAQG